MNERCKHNTCNSTYRNTKQYTVKDKEEKELHQRWSNAIDAERSAAGYGAFHSESSSRAYTREAEALEQVRAEGAAQAGGLCARGREHTLQAERDDGGTSSRYMHVWKEAGTADHPAASSCAGYTGTASGCSYKMGELRQVFCFIYYNLNYVEHPVRNI